MEDVERNVLDFCIGYVDKLKEEFNRQIRVDLSYSPGKFLSIAMSSERGRYLGGIDMRDGEETCFLEESKNLRELLLKN